jgi:hypothetical protein
MIRNFIYYFSWIFLVLSCQTEKSENDDLPSMGDWRGIIHTQGQELPFNFSLDLDHNQNLEVVLINGAEKIPITETEIINDSIFIPMHIFDADLVASFSKNEMRGFWRKNYAEDFFVPFSASYGGGFRFIDQPGEAQVNISGRWEVYFHNASGKSLAVGEFSQVGNKVSGTFLRPSGDYRYLIGTFIQEKQDMKPGALKGMKILSYPEVICRPFSGRGMRR